MVDERYATIYSRLSKFTEMQLSKILHSSMMCTDTFNYNSETGQYCPIAIALDIPQILKDCQLEPSQGLVLKLIREEGPKLAPGFEFGTVKGLAGKFYTTDREKDIKQMCRNLLRDKLKGTVPE